MAYFLLSEVKTTAEMNCHLSGPVAKFGSVTGKCYLASRIACEVVLYDL